MRHKRGFSIIKKVTAHYYLVLLKLQTTFCTEILILIGKSVLSRLFCPFNSTSRCSFKIDYNFFTIVFLNTIFFTMKYLKTSNTPPRKKSPVIQKTFII